MLKGKFTNNEGEPCVMIGLSEGNIKLLKEGKPILIKGSSINLDIEEIIIFYGETEELMVEDLRKHGFEVERK